MSVGLKKSIISLVIISLIAPSVFVFGVLGFAKKAEAQTECVTMIAGAIAAAFGLGFANAVTAVPVSDIPNLSSNASASGFTWGSFIKDCIIVPMFKQMIKTLIRQFTISVVNWINSGFEGSPSFVTNIGGFMGNVADEVAGQMIYRLGPIGQVLCSPFDLRIRVALGLYYTNTYKNKVVCKLSDIQKNLQNAFTAGDFNAGGRGWENWIALTTVPENNQYGSFLKTSSAIDAQIVGAQNIKLQNASWGRGFLSFEKCEETQESLEAQASYNTVTFEGANPKGSDEEIIARLELKRAKSFRPCKIATPGSTIQDSLSHSLGTDLRQYEIAQSIDAIFGALMNQMIGQIFNATGLFGASQPNQAYGGKSYLTTLASGNFDADFANNLALRNATQPQTGPFALPLQCSVFLNTYTLTGDGVVRYDADSNTFVPIPPLSPTDESRQALLNDFAQMNAYCQNKPLNDVTTASITSLSNSLTEQQKNLLDQFAKQQKDGVSNLALGLGSATKSSSVSTYNLIPSGPENAVDGSTFTAAVTGERTGEVNPWWQIDLGQAYPIGYINITPRTSRVGLTNCPAVSPQQALGSYSVMISATNPFPDTTTAADNGFAAASVIAASQGAGHLISSNYTGGAIPITVNVREVGQYVRIQRNSGVPMVAGGDCAEALNLAEVAIYNVKPPVITLTGAAAMTVTQGTVFTDPGATAVNDSGGSLNVTPSVVNQAGGNVAIGDITKTVGTYTITYTATDSFGTVATVKRTVTVTASGGTVTPPPATPPTPATATPTPPPPPDASALPPIDSLPQ